MIRRKVRRAPQAPALTEARQRLVDLIRALNPTASVAYLSEFNERSLTLYLEHLETKARPRGQARRWRRPGDSRPVLVRELDD